MKKSIFTDVGLFSKLSAHNTVYWHDEKPEELSVMEIRTAASRADVYISSVNGIAEGGENVNIDNTGNRVAPCTECGGTVECDATQSKDTVCGARRQMLRL